MLYVLAIFAVLLVVGLFAIKELLEQSKRGPWKCACGVEFDDPDKALYHAGVAKHTFDTK